MDSGISRLRGHLIRCLQIAGREISREMGTETREKEGELDITKS